MKEITIRSMLSIADKLKQLIRKEDELNQAKLVTHMSALQQDPLPAIRTNVIICLGIFSIFPPFYRKIGRIASVVSDHIRKQVWSPLYPVGNEFIVYFPMYRSWTS